MKKKLNKKKKNEQPNKAGLPGDSSNSSEQESPFLENNARANRVILKGLGTGLAKKDRPLPSICLSQYWSHSQRGGADDTESTRRGDREM